LPERFRGPVAPSAAGAGPLSPAPGGWEVGTLAESVGRFKDGILGVRANGQILLGRPGDLGYDFMMSSVLKPPAEMTVAEFLAWDAPGVGRWELVDGEPIAMAPASRTHGALQLELGGLIRNHLADAGSPCTVIAAPGIIPRVLANENFRIPELAVTCTRYETEEYDVSNPVLIVEILSPSNRAETWRNVWSYTTIPSLREILILSSTAIRAELLRRGDDGSWPATPTMIKDGDLCLDSIDFTVGLAAIYRTTRLARG
jgi:Uma2 family endonuclease